MLFFLNGEESVQIVFLFIDICLFIDCDIDPHFQKKIDLPLQDINGIKPPIDDRDDVEQMLDQNILVFDMLHLVSQDIVHFSICILVVWQKDRIAEAEDHRCTDNISKVYSVIFMTWILDEF